MPGGEASSTRRTDLLGRVPTPPTLNSGDNFAARSGRLGDIGHSGIHRLAPMPYRLCLLSGRNGVHPTRAAQRAYGGARSHYERDRREIIPCGLRRKAYPASLAHARLGATYSSRRSPRRRANSRLIRAHFFLSRRPRPEDIEVSRPYSNSLRRRAREGSCPESRAKIFY